MNALLTLECVSGIFCDALVHDQDDYLIFTSLWGRDTAIQELLARVTLSSQEGGLRYLTFTDQRQPAVRLGDPGRLDKLTGRMPKTNIFGDIVQLWLFDKRVQEPDFANRTAYLLVDERQQHASTELDEQIWQLYKSVCHLPMLDHWQATLLDVLQREQWLRRHEGLGIRAVSIQLPALTFDSKITQLIGQGDLTL